MRCFDGHGAAALQIECVQAMATTARQTQTVRRDQVDRVVIFEQRDVGVAAHALAQCGDYCVAGRVRSVNDPAMTMAAFARQMEAEFRGVVFGERNALRDQPFDGGPPMLDDETRGGFVAQTAACDQRVAHMVFDAVCRIQYRGNAALRPVARAFGHGSLCDHCNPPRLCKVERDAQTSQTATDNCHIEFHCPHLRLSFCHDAEPFARR
jgi:hypothetical protein